MIARGIGTLLRHPLLQFLLIGGAVFAVSRGWDAGPGNGNIVIAQPAIDQMISTYQGQFGVKPTSQQLQALIDRHVDDEVLYREGVALGVDRRSIAVGGASAGGALAGREAPVEVAKVSSQDEVDRLLSEFGF